MSSLDQQEEQANVNKNDEIINISELTKVFDVADGKEVAVDGISFSVKEGEFLTVIGPSGCGKTTTLRCIAGLEIPTSGEINFEGVDVTDVPANSRNLAMMFQNIALYPHMNIIDNISYPLKVEGYSKEKRYNKAREAAEIMQISDLLEKYPGEVSGGQRQRAALARTMVQDPIGFLMDEPLSDLDAKLKIEIRKEIQKVHKRLNKPTIYVTHDQEEAMTMSDRIAIMNNGTLEQIGTRDEVYNYPNNKFVAKFLGNPSINEIDATIIDQNESVGRISIYDKSFEYNVGFCNDRTPPTKVTVGIRPQSVNISKSTRNADFEGKLKLLEPINDRALARVDGPESEIRALIPTPDNIQEGDPIGISFATNNLYIFDKETGNLIMKSK